MLQRRHPASFHASRKEIEVHQRTPEFPIPRPSELYHYHGLTAFEYETEIRCAIPGYDELHGHVGHLLRNMQRRLRVLELGVGTGVTAKIILAAIPHADYFGIDFSPDMLEAAKAKFKQEQNVRLECNDYMQMPFPPEQDLVVAVLGPHHQSSEGKKVLFKKIYDSLKEDGQFIFGDLMTYRDEREAAINEALHYAFMVLHIRDLDSLRDWAYHHKFLNNLSPFEDQMDWLKDTGFREIAVIYQSCNTFLLHTRK